jgi:hypothetical protein
MAPTSRRRRQTGEDDPPYIEPVMPPLDQPLALSPEVGRHNYSDLVRLYYRTTQAPLAVKLYKERGRNLAVVLRDHRQRPIVRADEIEWREAFDHLMACYAMLELALQAGYITTLSPSMRRDALAILEDRRVRPFYETHYPLLLPQLLRIRLAGGRAHPAHGGPRQLAALQRTIELDRRLLARPEVGAFLTLADDFLVDGFDRSDLVDAVRDPASLVDHLTRRGRRQTFLDQAVLGLLQFLHLCEGLQHVLQSVEGDAEFQSGIWHIFGYWFADRREAVIPTLRTMIRQMHRSALALPPPAALTTRGQAEELLSCIDDLASARYAKPLRDVLRSLKRTEHGATVKESKNDARKALIKAMKAEAKRTGEFQQNRKANIAVDPKGRVRPIVREE